MDDLESIRPVSSLPARLRPAPKPVQQRRFARRDTLRPNDAHYSSWSRSSPKPSKPSRVSEAEYQRIVDETIAELENGNKPLTRPPQLQQRYPSQTQSQPDLPLNAHAGKRPPRPSLRASILAASSFHVPRADSAPPILPVATAPKSQLRQVVNGNYPIVDWRKLPQPLFELVLRRLQEVHVGRSSTSCMTCLMRDISSLERTCRAWYSAAQRHLYTNIHIAGVDSPSKLKRFQVKHGARLVLLRRTLRAKPLVAALVKEVHVPDPIIPLYLPDGHPNPDYDHYLCLLASLVMECQSLEIFTGFYPFYNHTFDRLTHALSTRKKLKQHVWIIAENDEVSLRSKLHLPPGLLDDHQIYQFEAYHDCWGRLETLMLCSPGSHGVLEHDVFVNILHSLPRLKNVCVSSFDADDFDDCTLMALPHLKSLRIEECTGVTDAGLARWAASPNSFLIERLALIHQSIASLVTVANLLARLDRLQKLTILQTDVAPTLPLDMVVFQPLFASRSLKWLHWDIGDRDIPKVSRMSKLHDLVPGDRTVEPATPNMHLALSILNHGFPSLTHIRAPRDVAPSGTIQSICRPARNANILLPRDTSALHMYIAPSTSNSLQVARIRAQRLIDEAWTARKDHTKVLITDHSFLPSAEDMEGALSTSTSRSSNLSHLTTSTDVTEPAPSASSGDSRYRIGEDRDKEAVMYDQDADDSCRCVPVIEQTCRCEHSDFPKELDKLRRSQALRRTRNRRIEEKKPDLPPRSPLRDAGAGEALKVQEFSLPTFIGRVSIHISSSGQVFQPPRFHLLPDIEGRDGNGGLFGWGELLRVSERAKAAGRRMAEHANMEEDWRRDGCDGSWNKDRERDKKDDERMAKPNREGEQRWRHTMREKGQGQWEGIDIKVGHFF